jgi:hypothetical protein
LKEFLEPDRQQDYSVIYLLFTTEELSDRIKQDLVDAGILRP